MGLGGLTASLTTTSKVKASFPSFQVLVSLIENIEVKEVVNWFEAFKEEDTQEAIDSYNPELLKDEPVFRVHRDFFRKIRVDLTRNRPDAEALIRRVASGKHLSRINILVELYKLTSIKTEITVSAFTADRLHGNLKMRYTKKDEKSLRIGMKKTLELHESEIVVQDEENLVAIYSYRDTEDSKVTENTMNAHLLFCAVLEISQEKLSSAIETTLKLIIHFCSRITKTWNLTIN